MMDRANRDKALSDRDLLIVLGERSSEYEFRIRELQITMEKELSGVREQVRERVHSEVSLVMRQLEGMQQDMNKRVTYERFRPVELIVFGLAGAILAAVIGAILTLVIVSPSKSEGLKKENPPTIFEGQYFQECRPEQWRAKSWLIRDLQ